MKAFLNMLRSKVINGTLKGCKKTKTRGSIILQIQLQTLHAFHHMSTAVQCRSEGELSPAFIYVSHKNIIKMQDSNEDVNKSNMGLVLWRARWK